MPYKAYIVFQNKHAALTIKKSSRNFPDSMAGNLLRRLETCLSREFSQGISPTNPAKKKIKSVNDKIVIKILGDPRLWKKKRTFANLGCFIGIHYREIYFLRS